MSNDPEAAWPLIQTAEQAPTASSIPPLYGAAPANAALVQPNSQYGQSAPLPVAPVKAESPGVAIAKLTIIMVLAIPLTAIAVNTVGMLGLIVAWIGIAAVAGFALLPPKFRQIP